MQNQEEYRNAQEGNHPQEKVNMMEEEITHLTKDATEMPTLRRISRWGENRQLQSSKKSSDRGENREMQPSGMSSSRGEHSQASEEMLPPHPT